MKRRGHRESVPRTSVVSVIVLAFYLMCCFLHTGPFHHAVMGFSLSFRGCSRSIITARSPFSFILEAGSQSLDDAAANMDCEERNNSTDATSLATSSTMTSNTKQCPVVKYFPRYRIDLKNRKRQKREAKNAWLAALPSFEFPPSPLKGIFQSLEKSRMEKRLQQQSKSGEELVWIPNVDGISALTELWTYADRLLKSSTNDSIVLCLPDASSTLVQNWVKIVEWMASNCYPYLADDNSSILLEATLLLESSDDDDNDDDEDDSSIQRKTVRLRKRTRDTVKGDAPSIIAAIDDFEKEETINRRTQAWVKRILVDQGICPFTKSVKMSGQGLMDVGVPVGSIAYHASSATHPITLFADTFQAIRDMIQSGPSGKSGVSSILLAAPAFDDDFDLWSGPVFAMLEASVVSAMAEAQVGVVCFHPKYACPDGSSWPGFGHMHSVTRLENWYKASLGVPSSSLPPTTTTTSDDEEKEATSCPLLGTEDIAAGGAWQRRTPHATINVLRADQLEAAEAKRSSGELYVVNIEKLVGSTGIGSDQLARDLEKEKQLL
jgi:hypothetical protein